MVLANKQINMKKLRETTNERKIWKQYLQKVSLVDIRLQEGFGKLLERIKWNKMIIFKNN